MRYTHTRGGSSIRKKKNGRKVLFLSHTAHVKLQPTCNASSVTNGARLPRYKLVDVGSPSSIEPELGVWSAYIWWLDPPSTRPLISSKKVSIWVGLKRREKERRDTHHPLRGGAGQLTRVPNILKYQVSGTYKKQKKCYVSAAPNGKKRQES